MYLLGVSRCVPWYKRRNKTDDRELIEQLARQLDFAGETYVISLLDDESNKKMRKVMRAVTDAQIIGA